MGPGARGKSVSNYQKDGSVIEATYLLLRTRRDAGGEIQREGKWVEGCRGEGSLKENTPGVHLAAS